MYDVVLQIYSSWTIFDKRLSVEILKQSCTHELQEHLDQNAIEENAIEKMHKEYEQQIAEREEEITMGFESKVCSSPCPHRD